MNYLSKVMDEDDIVHHHDICFHSNCSAFSKEEEDRQKRFQHQWLLDRKSYDEVTELWWCVFPERKGIFCLLWSRHDTSNSQKKMGVVYPAPSLHPTIIHT